MEAAARILKREGPDGLTTNRVAEVAGVSIGSLYQYFPTKQAVAAGLVEHLLGRDRELVARTLGDLGSASLAEGLAALGRVMCARQHSVAPVLRHLLPLLSELERDALVAREIDAMLATFGAFVRARRAELRAELREDEALLDDAIFVAGHGVRGALNAAAVDRPERLLDPAFVELLLRQLRALLIA